MPLQAIPLIISAISAAAAAKQAMKPTPGPMGGAGGGAQGYSPTAASVGNRMSAMGNAGMTLMDAIQAAKGGGATQPAMAGAPAATPPQTTFSQAPVGASQAQVASPTPSPATQGMHLQDILRLYQQQMQPSTIQQ